MKDVFLKNITYVEYARSGVEYYTENLEELKELAEKGWKFNKYIGGFRVIPPEECIVDITDYQKAMQYGNPIFNLAYYDFLKELIEQNKINSFINQILEDNIVYYRDFQFLVSYGPILDTEIRISGSDDRIKKLKIDMVENFIDSNKYSRYIANVESEINTVRELSTCVKKLKDNSNKEQNFYKEVQEFINVLNKTRCYNPNQFKIYNYEKIENCYDVVLFIPFGCFKYLSSFTNEDNIEKIMFWEFHAESSKEHTFKLYEKDLTDKRVLIIDNMYSGKTMQIAKNKVEKLGGIPITLGMNPKNKNNILTTDYTMILNHIFEKNELNIADKDLFRNLYINIFKEC